MTDRLFDIVTLAFPPDTSAARARFDFVLDRYSNFIPPESQPRWGATGRTIFESVDGGTAGEILDALDAVGVRTEIRPVSPTKTPPSPGAATPVGVPCPSCGFSNDETSIDCAACGVVFAKFEQLQVRRMMEAARLEEEVNRIQRIRQEWTEKALSYREKRPLAPAAIAPFKSVLVTEEVPFLRLDSDRGPLLLTSLRLLTEIRGEMVSIPYETIAEAELGGGFQVLGGNVRMALTLKSPLMVGRTRVPSLTRQVQKNAAWDPETVMDWIYSRNFICGGCGARDLDFRLENRKTRVRCMRCARDHEVDPVHAVLRLIGEPQ